MVMESKIYTKMGDKGETSLFSGERVSKTSLRVEAYGTIDELNSMLGTAKTHAKEPLYGIIQGIQERLFFLASEIATKDPEKVIRSANAEEVKELEKLIDELTEQMPKLENFLVPGGNKCAAILHIARTICRRAERRIIDLNAIEEINPMALKYVNRLSDVLFTLARYANHSEGVPDQIISRDLDLH
jgi:cob(I)alamin adenosyltransferase